MFKGEIMWAKGSIDVLNNKARSFRLMQNTVRWRFNQLDGVVVRRFLGTPGQTKVSKNHQRETNIYLVNRNPRVCAFQEIILIA